MLSQNKAPIMSDFFPVTLHLSANPLVFKIRSSVRELRARLVQRMMDVEGGRAVRRSRGAGRLAGMVAVLNLLVVTCMLVTFYIYMKPPVMPEDNVYILFEELNGLSSNMSLEFNDITENRTMTNDKGNISVSCRGPYVWHMYVCYETMGGGRTSGTLVLKVKNTSVSSFKMDATEEEVCRGLHSIVYLMDGDVVSSHLYSSKEFRLVRVRMGLSYLLGNNCIY